MLPDDYVSVCDTTLESAMWRGLKAWVHYVSGAWEGYDQQKLQQFRLALVAEDAQLAWELQQDLQQDYPMDIVTLSGATLTPTGPFNIEEAFQ